MYDAQSRYQQYIEVGCTEDEALAVMTPLRDVVKNPTALQLAIYAKDKMSQHNAAGAAQWYLDNPNSILANQRKGFYNA